MSEKPTVSGASGSAAPTGIGEAPAVPFIDLRAQYRELRPGIDAALRRVLESGQFVLGPEVENFEREYAAWIGVKECVCVNSGTAALQLGLMALGLRQGDEVLLPANTFFATAEAVLWAGGTPVLVDVREDDFNIDPERAEAAITSRTRAIIPVDLYGQTARYDELLDLAARRGLFLLEDACQAHGAEHRGWKAGRFGAAAAFSFYPGKNLGAYGEGGALVTDDPGLARQVRMLRNHGQAAKYDHAVLGHNYRLESLQGAVLGAKLPRLDAWNAARRRVAGWYREALAGLPLVLPAEMPWAHHVYHLFVIRVAAREEFRAFLRGRGVETLVHYPVPLHLQKALAGLGLGPGSFPVSEALAGKIVSLPIYPELTREQVAQVAAAAAAFFSARGGGGGA